MYNRYLNGREFVLLEPEAQETPPGQPQRHASQPQRLNQPAPPPPRSRNDLVGEVTGSLGQLLEGVRSHFSLKNFDTGDILLVLIILFLYLEGDNLELVITLGLLLLLGLGDEEPEDGP